MNKPNASLTEGSIIKSLLTLAIPIIGVNLLQTAYQLTDAFWVGRLGAGAVAAVSVSFPINFLLISLGSGLAVAGSIMVAQFAGARNMKMVSHVAAQTILMVLMVSILLSVVAYLLSPSILHALGVGPDIFADANRFQRVTFIGLFFTYGFIMFQSVMRGIGEVKLPLYINLVTVCLNFALDPLFIYGWGPIAPHGVAGAAIATLSTQILSVIVAFYVLLSGKKGILINLKEFSPDWPLIRKAFNLGFPSSIELSARALGMSVMVVLVTGFGTGILAVYGTGTRILSFVVIPALGISMSCSTLVGQNIGAGNIQRAVSISRLAAWSSFWILSVIGVIFYFAAEYIVRFFIPHDPAVISEGVVFVHIVAFSFGFIGVQQALIGTFRGSGNTVVTMVLSIIAVWVLQFPLGYALSKHTSLGYRGLWWAFPISNVLAALAALVWYTQSNWQNKRIVNPMMKQVNDESVIESGGGD